MRTAEEETWEVHKILVDLHLPYAIIDGTAVQIWGEPRYTKDLDLTYWINIFSELLETSDVIDRFEQAWRKYGPEG